MNREEKEFQKDFEEMAFTLGYAFYSIPDQNMRFTKGLKRPFDGVLITKHGNHCIEFKIQNRPLKEHQAKIHQVIYSINAGHYVIRKFHNELFKIQQNGANIAVFRDLENMIEFLAGDL